MALLRDEDGNFYEVSSDALKKLKKVEPPLADGDAYFPASDYRWDPRDNPPGGAGEPSDYRWQAPAYRWRPTDYRWNPPQPPGGSASD